MFLYKKFPSQLKIKIISFIILIINPYSSGENRDIIFFFNLSVESMQLSPVKFKIFLTLFSKDESYISIPYLCITNIFPFNKVIDWGKSNVDIS